ncbi:MAG: hypothetical protein IPJ37_01925 [Bacteroidales bacterium]|nr:hypothetical protein [Bacteroidales bacterium]
MNKVILLALMCLVISCGTSKKSSPFPKEDELYSTRKYIGDFLDYRHTGPEVVGGKDLIWIKTSIYSTFGRISAYGKSCEFAIGDKIYLKSTSASPGNYGYWEYQIENDYLVTYKVSEFKLKITF